MRPGRAGQGDADANFWEKPGNMVPLGYGKYFRSDSIVGLEPIEEGRGPGKRTRVFIASKAEPVVASRSEGAILRDMVEMPTEYTRTREYRELLTDIADSIDAINPMLRFHHSRSGPLGP
jgi:hypothetical protein